MLGDKCGPEILNKTLETIDLPSLQQNASQGLPCDLLVLQAPARPNENIS